MIVVMDGHTHGVYDGPPARTLILDLTHFQEALRRLLPGRKNAYLRRSARGLADHFTRNGAGAVSAPRIVEQLRQWYGDRISNFILAELETALSADIPGGHHMLMNVRDSAGQTLCLVNASTNADEVEQAEENIILAVTAVKTAFAAVSKVHTDWPAQPRLLYAIQILVMAQNNGRRDEEHERAVFSHWVATYGVGELASLLDVDLGTATQLHT